MIPMPKPAPKAVTPALELKLTRAKAALVLEQPFFASLLLKMPIIWDGSLNPPTMATNGQYIKVHPNFVDEHDHDELRFVLCHEVMHGAFAHVFRRGERNPRKWNAAGDYIINDMLVNEKIGRMPSRGLLNPALVKQGGGHAEGIYAILPDEDEGDDGAGSGAGGGGFPNGDGSQGEPFDSQEDAPGTPAEQAAQEAEWKVSVAQAAQAAKMHGKLSQNMRRFIDDAMRPVVDWRDVMRRFFSQRAKVDPSYARPKRRWLGEDFILPSLSGEKLGHVVVPVDCSGSVGDKELAAFAAEIRAIKQDTHPEMLTVIYWADGVGGHQSFGPDDEVKIEPNITGGTCYAPVSNYIEAQGIEPVACVVLTDLYIGDFGPQPGYPVLWVSTASDKAPWGEVVMMDKRTL